MFPLSLYFEYTSAEHVFLSFCDAPLFALVSFKENYLIFVFLSLITTQIRLSFT